MAGTTEHAKGVANHRTSNATSIDVAGAGHEIAEMYFFMLADGLVDLAERISADFVRRPHVYTSIGGDTAELLVRLHQESGSRMDLPSRDRRYEIYGAVFSQTSDAVLDAQGEFPRLASELIQATTAYAERVVDTGESMLVERARSSHVTFRQYLVSLDGGSLRTTWRLVISPLATKVAYPILRDREVASVFGVPAPDHKWPFTEDANGSRLVGAVSSQLVDSTVAAPLTRQRFTNLQRAALRGADALATVIDFPDGGDDRGLLKLIGKCYSWGVGLSNLTVPTAPAARTNGATTTPTALTAIRR